MTDCQNQALSCTSASICESRLPNALVITNLVRGGTIIQWDLIKIPEVKKWKFPFTIVPQYSRHGAANEFQWFDLGEVSTSQNTFEISNQIPFGSEFSVYYRFKLSNSNGDVVVTRPQHAFDIIPRQIRTEYNEVIRRWYDRAARQEIRTGYLLKRARWGYYCNSCIDRDGRHKIKTQCPVCYDVGFLDGYMQYSKCFSVEVSPTQFAENVEFSSGFTQQGPVGNFKFLNIPEVYPGDVWVDMKTDERWMIGSPMTTKIRLGSYDIVREAPAARFDTTHVVYGFPITRG